MVILKAENISKQYRLGLVGTGTLSDDIKRWWYSLKGKEDPFLKVGDENDRSSRSNADYVWALRDINFEVEKGEVLGIIGQNGAGKSTLLKILSRVTAPTTGSIKTKGRIASLLEVGTGFHGELTGRENIFMNGAVLGMTKSEIRSKLDEIIAFSGCEKYIDTPVKRYSSGMTVRLGFAVAAHLEPEILVVDEVLAVGDAEFQKKAIGKMQDLSMGEGRTVLFVSHNMASVSNLCSRVIVLNKGSIGYVGNTEGGVDFYLNMNSKSNASSTYEAKVRSGTSGIENLYLYDYHQNIRSEFRFDERINIACKLKIKQIDLDAYLGLKVIDKTGKVIFTSQIQLSSFIGLEGEHNLRVTIPSKFLVPNSYWISFGLHIPNKRLIDNLEKILFFNVVETGSEFHIYQGVDYGCVFLDCDWTLTSSKNR